WLRASRQSRLIDWRALTSCACRHIVRESIGRGPVGELVVARRIGRRALRARDPFHEEANQEVVLGIGEGAGYRETASGLPAGLLDEHLNHAPGIRRGAL